MHWTLFLKNSYSFSETKKTKTPIEAIDNLPKGQEANVIDAASQGAMTAVFLVANIGAAIIATLAFIAFINGVLSWTCLLIGYDDVTLEYILGTNITLMRLRDYLELCSDREYFGLYCFYLLSLILGWIFYPFAWLMGVENDDLETVGQLLGVKSLINEFVAYSNLQELENQLSERSKVTGTYS